MSRILTGIQSTNTPHLGNLLGAILPAIELSRQPQNESMFFIADLHTLTSRKDAALNAEVTRSVAATWLAFGLDTDKSVFYRQSRVPRVTELTWYLNCFTPYPMLANAHSFKDKSSRLSDVNAGLFTYPVLMAADILLYDADIVPVGKDQLQHLEIAADIAGVFNRVLNRQIMKVPKAVTDENVMIVPGTDGHKMSKSRNNFINIFLPEKELKKVVMGIVTDSTPVESPKDPEKCNVYAIYRLLATNEDLESMRQRYLAGGMGYGHAKTALFETIITRFRAERENYTRLMEDQGALENLLRAGEQRAAAMADAKLAEVRTALGF